MESMLYTVRMNGKPNLPEEIQHCTWRSLKAGGGWMFLAMGTSIAADYLLPHHKDWPLALRAVVVMIPLAAGLLYVRSTARWIRGMDELHRYITLSAFLFATVAYLLLNTAWPLLDKAGVFEAISQVTSLRLERLYLGNCTVTLALTYIFWGIGLSIFNRRYQ
jgi:hypothetical protein